MPATKLSTALAEGERRSVGRADEAAVLVRREPRRVEELLGCLAEGEDPALRAHAAHALMQVGRDAPEVLHPFADRLIHEVGADPQWELREQFSKVAVRLELSKRQAKAVAELFQDYLSDRHSIVRTCALQGLFDLSSDGRYPAASVRRMLQHAEETGSKAMAARARRLLAKLAH
ncbi:MAG: hypothetical protein AAGF12_33010 [Myxococcota bacterium]